MALSFDASCACHDGSVCGKACAVGRHHDGCPTAGKPTPARRQAGRRACRGEGMRRELFGQAFAHATGLYDSLSAVTAGRTLSCRTCRREESPSRDDMAGYFRSGWPKCCGYTMTLDKLPPAPSRSQE